ncbi:Dual specificity protein kinase lkh1 [Durusdinium trenchii]|uniref:Dual specificity protein kinase lkh1 n=1 Tax=Durusdinium trenchii TaxID=1381693 RepID=A0ABP0M4M1_9DINO
MTRPSNGSSKSFDASLLEDDGSLDLALMVSDHPVLKSCGQALLTGISEVNQMIQRCGPWIAAKDFPPEGTMEVNKMVSEALTKVQDDMQRLDDLDLDLLKPEWGDRDSVRMARKSLIGFGQVMTQRLESLKNHLAQPVAKFSSMLGEKKQFTTFYAWDSDGIEATKPGDAVNGGEDPEERLERERSRSRDAKGKGEERSDESENSEERKWNRDTPHFQWTKGMKLGAAGRYVVKKKVGEGSFGRVLACVDETTKHAVAVKVVKGVPRYKEHAHAEAELLREILRCDPGRQSFCVKLLGEFTHAVAHCCLVFELLDISLSDFMRDTDDRGLLLRDIRTIGSQMLQCLHFLSAMGLTHTDIKCRNAMLKDSRGDMVPHPRKDGQELKRLRRCEIRVIDFGGAVLKKERHSRHIGTRQYRSPEVVLGLAWDEKTDVWSLGCILLTLYTGQRPFPVQSSLQHLALMQRVIGNLPKDMVKLAAAGGSLPEDVVVDSRGGLQIQRKLSDEAQELLNLAQPLEQRVLPQHGSFLKLLEGLLAAQPEKRLSAAEALKQDFLSSEPVE